MKRLSVVASHLCAAPASSVAVAVDVDAIVEAPGDEAPRLIALAQLAKEGEINAEELLAAKLKVLGVAEAPTVDQTAVSGSEYVVLDSDAGQSLLESCTSDRGRECSRCLCLVGPVATVRFRAVFLRHGCCRPQSLTL